MSWDDIEACESFSHKVRKVFGEPPYSKERNVYPLGTQTVPGKTNIYKWLYRCNTCWHNDWGYVYGEERPEQLIATCSSCNNKSYLLEYKEYEGRIDQ